MTPTEAIRAHLKARGESVRKVHLATGLQRLTIKDFLDGGIVKSDTLDTLCEYLGLSIAPPPPKPADSKKGK